MSFEAALDLPCDTFAAILRASYIEKLRESEEGRQYLADCERLTKTEPDLDAVRRMKGYKAV